METTGSGTRAARDLAARRRRIKRSCEVCGTEFTGVATRRYCSAACRLRASRERRQAEKPAPVPDTVEGLKTQRETNARHGRGIGPDSIELLWQSHEEHGAELAPLATRLAEWRDHFRGREIRDSTEILRESREGDEA